MTPKLKMTCDKCSVSNTCPAKGRSPYVINGKIIGFCQIIGGYGREPVDTRILSSESLARSKKDGLCMTIADIPTSDGEDEVIKIFHDPVLHARERAELPSDAHHPKGYKS